MSTAFRVHFPAAIASALVLTACGAEPTTVEQAVNTFQNSMATGGGAFTVDVQGPAAITDETELVGFAFGTYDVDATASSVTLTLVADLDQLQITQYDSSTFDRYYFSFDAEIGAAEISDATHPDFSATVELIEPGTSVTTDGTFVEGLATDFTFETGGFLITIGDGTDLTPIREDGGSLTVEF